MRKSLSTAFVIVLLFSSSLWASGDLGGGGTLRKIQRDFQLSSQEKSLLNTQEERREARDFWLKNMSENYKEELLKNVYKHHIKPQLKGFSD